MSRYDEDWDKFWREARQRADDGLKSYINTIGKGDQRIMLTLLRNLNLDRLDLSESLSLHAFGKSLQAEYDAFQIETPDWLTVNMASLKREIQDRVRDELMKQIRMDEARLETLKTRDEKREETARRLEERKAKLAAASGGILIDTPKS